jgi:hypothetical protein
MFLQRDVFTHKCFFHREGPSHRDGLTQRDYFTNGCFYTQVLLHGHVFNGEMFLHTGVLGDDDDDGCDDDDDVVATLL